MQYLRARYYSTQQGCFISEDPFPGLLTQPSSLTPYVYALNNPVLYTDPSGKYIESPLDVAFIVYDVGSIIWDVNRIQQNTCHSGELVRQLWIDAGALALDAIFLALPGATGGGMGLRYAFEGANISFDTLKGLIALQNGYRVTQVFGKSVQVGGQIGNVMTFAKKPDNSSGSDYSSGGRPLSNKAQNSQFRGAIQEIEQQLGKRLSQDQIQRLHWALHDLENPGFWDIVKEGLNMFGGK